MSLIVLASDKGSPGVTTTAMALAGVWPRRAILAECDPSGGDLVYRALAENGGPLNPNVGILSLAITARHGLSPHQLGQHVQRMHGGLELVAGLATGDQSAGLAGLWPTLGRAFAALPDADVIADCGRVGGAGPALDLMAAATLVVLVARTSAEQIAHVRDRALSLLQRLGGGTPAAGGGLGVPIGVVLIVDPKQRARITAQVDELLRNSGLPVKVIGTIADDADGARLINGRGRGRVDRTLLIRSTREVALDLYRRYTMPSQGPSQSPSQGHGTPGGGPVPQPGGPVPPQAQAGVPVPPQAQPGVPVPPQAPPGAPNPMPRPVPGQPAHGYQPAAPGYQSAAPQPPTPPVPGQQNQPSQPGFQHGAPPQPGAPWPVGQPPTPPRSAHEGFTSVTLGGDRGPRDGLAAPQYSPDSHADDTYRLPPRGEIGPGPGGYLPGPEQGGQ